MEFKFNSTQLIASVFDFNGIKYDVKQQDECEVLQVGFAIKFGHECSARFLVRNDNCDISVLTSDIFTEIPEYKHQIAVAECNRINCTIRLLKFCLDPQGNINVRCDYPIESSPESAGDIACEMLARIMFNLDQEYHALAAVLYSNDGSNAQQPDDATLEEFALKDEGVDEIEADWDSVL